MVFQGSLRRLFAALLVALAVTFALTHTRVILPSPCLSINPVDNPWLWWWYGCDDGEPGGGGSGAGD